MLNRPRPRAALPGGGAGGPGEGRRLHEGDAQAGRQQQDEMGVRRCTPLPRTTASPRSTTTSRGEPGAQDGARPDPVGPAGRRVGRTTAQTRGSENTSSPAAEDRQPGDAGQVQRHGHQHRGEGGLLHEHPGRAAQPADLDEQPRVDERVGAPQPGEDETGVASRICALPPPMGSHAGTPGWGAAVAAVISPATPTVSVPAADPVDPGGSRPGLVAGTTLRDQHEHPDGEGVSVRRRSRASRRRRPPVRRSADRRPDRCRWPRPTRP